MCQALVEYSDLWVRRSDPRSRKCKSFDFGPPGTGLHSFGLPRYEAIELRRTHVGTSLDRATDAINRISVWAGQIAAYTVGADVIDGLRQEIAAARGVKFDIREFHDVGLRNGPLIYRIAANVSVTTLPTAPSPSSSRGESAHNS